MLEADHGMIVVNGAPVRISQTIYFNDVDFHINADDDVDADVTAKLFNHLAQIHRQRLEHHEHVLAILKVPHEAHAVSLILGITSTEFL